MRTYVIVNDTPGYEPIYFAATDGPVSWRTTTQIGEARTFAHRGDAAYFLHLYYKHKQGWRIVTERTEAA